MQREFYQKTKLGKIRRIVLTLEGNEVKTSWGFVDSAKPPQVTSEPCDSVYYPGHAGYKTPEQQAKIVFDRWCKQYEREGNYATQAEAEASDPAIDFVLHPLPTQFRGPKPIAGKPCLDKKDPEKYHIPNRTIQKLIDAGDIIATKKYNGLHGVMTKVEGVFHLYSISMKEMSANYKWLVDWFQNYAVDFIPDDSLFNMEIIAGEGETMRDFKVIVSMKPNTSPQRAAEIASEYLEKNPGSKLGAVVLGPLFWGGVNVTKTPYQDRVKPLFAAISAANDAIAPEIRNAPQTAQVSIPLSFTDFYHADKAMRQGKWEGLVLNDRNATTEFSMNSKYPRPKGAWKWKNVETDEFFVHDVLLGTGANYGVYSTLCLAQYDVDGNFIDCGCVGSGITDAMIADGLDKLKGKVVEIAFAARFDAADTKTGKPALQFPSFVCVRDDKKPEECIYEPCEE